MKKNFLKVAALLIAAMLLVVSCSQEVKAPENNGLVEAKLTTTFGRDIEIKDGTSTSALTYKYTMVPNWNGGDKVGTEDISGIVNNETVVEKDKSLGWVTPGLWTVKVFAYDGEQKVFEGENDAYFSNKNNKVTVYLRPVDDANNNKLTFNIEMQDLDVNGGLYKLKYSVVGTPKTDEDGSDATTNKTGELTRSDSAKQNVGVYTLDENDTKLNALPSDYYRVTVSIYDGDNKLLGGITKGVLLSNGDEGKVTGNIEPSDYIKAQFDVKLINVVTSLIPGNVAYYSDTAYSVTTETDNTAKAAKVVITLKNDTIITNYDDSIDIDEDGISITHTWYVDGETVASPNPNAETGVDGAGNKTLTLKDTVPGYKNVSCQTIYSMTDSNGVTYYWANTASVQVPFEGKKFAKN